MLDLFCGGGGASMGYYKAGFDVVGVDINPQPNYPFEFYQADALTFPLKDFVLIHASPPCQSFTRAGHLRTAQGHSTSAVNLIPQTREHLVAGGVAYIIENVEGAPLLNPIKVCGSSFGLGVRRHRLFESNFKLSTLPCRHKEQGRPIGVYYNMADEIPHGGRTASNLEEAQTAMGIDWLPWKSLKESIPPAYTHYLGSQIMTILRTG